MATASFLTAAAKASTEKATYLLEIDLIGTGTTYASSKTIYLSDQYVTIETVDYEGIVLNWGGLDVDLPSNEGIASINDFSITLANQRLMFFEADVRFSDILDDYYFAGSVVRVYQWFDELTLKSDAELIFTGICKQPEFDLNEIRFEITEDDSVFIDIPTSLITLNEYSDAPDESIGNPLPIVYGNDWFFSPELSRNESISPCICVDKYLQKYCIANHEVKHSSLGTNGDDIKIYLEEAGIYGYLYAPNVSFNNDNEGAFFTLNGNIYYHFYNIPTIKGNQYSSAITDYADALDFSLATSITLNANETFYLKFDKFPSLGQLELSDSINIKLYARIGAVTGGSPYGTMKYYNAGYDAGAAPGFSTGQNITAGTGLTTYDIAADTSVKGVRDDQSDKDAAWSLDDLAGLEYGITVSAGCTIELQYLVLYVYRIPLKYVPKGLRIRRKR